MNFLQGNSGTEVQRESRLFSQGKNTRIHKNGRNSCGLPGRLLIDSGPFRVRFGPFRVRFGVLGRVGVGR